MVLSNYFELEDMFAEAERQAKKSPCVRRQYGAVIYNDDMHLKSAANNARVSKVCNDFCIRERVGIANGTHTQTELGAEVHAEAAVLIKHSYGYPDHFILVGFMHGHELLGEDAYPCLSCAKMIKFAGFRNIFLRDKNREIRPYSISEIIEQLEDGYDVP